MMYTNSSLGRTDYQCEWMVIIVVMGEKLIEMFEKEKVSLGI